MPDRGTSCEATFTTIKGGEGGLRNISTPAGRVPHSSDSSS